jgi:hypothetical protein
VNCRVPIEFLFFVQLLAFKDLLALKVSNRLLDHPAQKVAGELAFCVM